MHASRALSTVNLGLCRDSWSRTEATGLVRKLVPLSLPSSFLHSRVSFSLSLSVSTSLALSNTRVPSEMIIIVDRVAMFSVRCRESMWHRRCLAGPSDHTVHRSSPSLPLPPRSTALLPGEPDPFSLCLSAYFSSLSLVCRPAWDVIRRVRASRVC